MMRMKKQILECDIINLGVVHQGNVNTLSIDVIFDHDQEDGKSKTKPYLDKVVLEICEGCKEYMLENRKYIYAYGAMGYNTYTL